MKKATYILLLSFILILSGCSSNQSTIEKEPVNKSEVGDAKKDETKKEINLTSGDLFNTVNEILRFHL